ncbi:MAG: hydantoinase/oxoprolinase family protein, partial [Alphaproteobacteria bacterium]|nr:hydantoinase/oxoprolinase family protein [Alphaproteobacteria bacterium]
GPVCYGRGGVAPTITDANLILGYLNPDRFNGGAMRLDRSAAAAVLDCQIAQPLGLLLEAAAWGVHSIANANMERAMRIVSIERGRDPRRYALVAFGGAGPLHACRLARALDVPRVIVPRGAGVGSALGLLVAEQKVDIGLTRVLRLNDATLEELAAIYAGLEARVIADARRMDTASAIRVQRSASMRYAGQGYELRVDLPDGPICGGYIEATLVAFRAAYQQEYGYVDPDTPVEASDWFAVATIAGSGSGVGIRLDSRAASGEAVSGERPAWFPEAGGMIPTKVIDRYALTPGQRLSGPALVEERECTIVVLPGDVVWLSPAGNVIIDISSGV